MVFRFGVNNWGLIFTTALFSPFALVIAELSSAKVGTPLNTDKAVIAAMLAVNSFLKNVFFMIISFVFLFSFFIMIIKSLVF
ncbi:Uncharacterised protein [Streptococcus pneumoniae]|nr:Uncharacterised protein [Streptococcus pneumoniae]CWG53750.1 Uncharacterised protein [Streptococcus pneumoniae]